MTMTKKDALTIALNSITDSEAREVIEKMIAQLSKPRTMSDEAKASANAKRKEKTAAARAKVVEVVAPLIRSALTAEPLTAVEIFAKIADALPEGFTANKVQYILLHEMADEVSKVETKGKANGYTLAV